MSEWLTDEATGRHYRVERIPRIEGTYRWEDEEHRTVRMRPGVFFDVVREEPDGFWVKVWRPIYQEPKSPQQPVVDPDAIAARYTTDLETVDRLRYGPFDQGLPRSGQWRNGFDVDDVDGDQNLDIVFGASRKARSPQPNIFLGDGSGGWRRWSEARFPLLPYDYGDAEAADLDGDGDIDLVLAVHQRGLVALRNAGGGTFLEWSVGLTLKEEGAFSSRAIELFDGDGDGRLDLLALGEGPGTGGSPSRPPVPSPLGERSRGLALFRNAGDGSWTRQPVGNSHQLRESFGDDLALGDFNGDGRTDVAVATHQMSDRGILGMGRTKGGWLPESLELLPSRAFLGGVSAADLGGDGVDELVVGFVNRDADRVWRTGIDLYALGGKEWQRESLMVTEDRRGIYGLAAGDLDRDGHLDLVAMTGFGEGWIFLGDGRGGFVRELSPELGSDPKGPLPGCRGYAVRLVDLDHDQCLEVIVAWAGEATGVPGTPFSHPGCEGGGSLRVWKALEGCSRGSSPP